MTSNRFSNEGVNFSYCWRISLPGPPKRDDSWLQVKQRITISNQKTERKSSLLTKHLISWRPQITYAVALTVMAILFIPFAYQYFNTEHIITDAGELDKKVLLTDGSTIHLNAKSRLSYKKDFNGDHRKVQLSGEAYFDVQKGPLPFIISTELAEIQVLGTLFNVRARRDGLEVGVNQGSVQIKNNDQSIILEEGEMTIVDPNNISLGFTEFFFSSSSVILIVSFFDNSFLEKSDPKLYPSDLES